MLHYQQILSMALEERSSGYQDLVSNNNALLAVMQRKGLWQTYQRPAHPPDAASREATSRSGTPATISCSTRRSICSTTPIFEPKMVVVPVILSMQEILNNEGEAQLMDVFDSYIEAAERALEDAMDAALYGDGSANGGKQLTGLATAMPIVTNTGVYGGIDRAHRNAIWRTNDLRRAHCDGARRSARRSTRPRSGRCSTSS